MSDLTALPVTVEHYREPVGIGDVRTRLSWVIRTDLAGWRQAAYELEIEPEGGPVFSSVGSIRRNLCWRRGVHRSSPAGTGGRRGPSMG